MNPVEELQTSDAVPVEGVGDRLRKARQVQGLSVDDVAQALKISPRQVELLEGGAWSELPGYTFVRGFVRNYARFLRLDVDSILKELESAAVPKPPVLELSAGTHVALPAQGQVQRRDFITMLLGAGLVLVALLVFFLLPEDWWNAAKARLMESAPASAPASASALEPAAAPALPAAPVFPPAVQPESSLPVAAPVAVETVPAGTPGAMVSPAAIPPAVVPAASPGIAVPSTMPAPTPAVTLPVSSAPVAASARPGAVAAEFSVSQLSWIEVQDKTGAILLSENLPAGTRRSVSGVPPLSVVVGNADGVKLTVNGKVVDLQSRTRNSVARLTLE